VAARYEVERVESERELCERAPILATAATVQFGLDGVMVPQEGEHCDPRGRTPEAIRSHHAHIAGEPAR
jgi:hypothetical protein